MDLRFSAIKSLVNRANLAAGPSSTSDDEECDAEFYETEKKTKDNSLFWTSMSSLMSKLQKHKSHMEFNYLILIGKIAKNYKKKLKRPYVRWLQKSPYQSLSLSRMVI